VLKYLFGTTTTIKEKTYIIVTGEANLVHPNGETPVPVSKEVASAPIEPGEANLVHPNGETPVPAGQELASNL
jgi:hypothetical protein